MPGFRCDVPFKAGKRQALWYFYPTSGQFSGEAVASFAENVNVGAEAQLLYCHFRDVQNGLGVTARAIQLDVRLTTAATQDHGVIGINVFVDGVGGLATSSGGFDDFPQGEYH